MTDFKLTVSIGDDDKHTTQWVLRNINALHTALYQVGKRLQQMGITKRNIKHSEMNIKIVIFKDDEEKKTV